MSSFKVMVHIERTKRTLQYIPFNHNYERTLANNRKKRAASYKPVHKK